MTEAYRQALLDLDLAGPTMRVGMGECRPPIVGVHPGIEDYAYPPCMLSLLYQPGPAHLGVYLLWDAGLPHVVEYDDESRTFTLVGLGSEAFTWRIVEGMLRIDDGISDRVRRVALDLHLSEYELALIDRHTNDHDELDGLSEILPTAAPSRLPPSWGLKDVGSDGSLVEVERLLAVGDPQSVWLLLQQGGWSFDSARSAVRALLAYRDVPRHLVCALQHWQSLSRPSGAATL